MSSEISGKKVTLTKINRNNTLGKIFDCIDNNFTRLANIINSGSLNTSIEVQEYITSEGQMNFVLDDTFIPGTNSLAVYVNNARQWEGSGFFEVGNQAFRLSEPCAENTLVKAVYIRVDPDYIKIDNVYDDEDIEDVSALPAGYSGATGINIAATDLAKVNEAIRQIQSMMIEVQSYVHGGTGSRRGESTDNATYLFNECQRMVNEIRTLRDELKSTSYTGTTGTNIDNDILVSELDATMVAYGQSTVDNVLKGIQTNLESLETLISTIDSSQIKYKNTTVELKLDNINDLMASFNRRLESTTVPADIEENIETIQNNIAKLQRAVAGTINASAVIYDDTGLTLLEELDSINRNIRTINTKITNNDNNVADDIADVSRSVERLTRSLEDLALDVANDERTFEKLNRTVSSLMESIDALTSDSAITSAKVMVGQISLDAKLADIDNQINNTGTSINNTNAAVAANTRRITANTDEIEDIKANLITLDRKNTRSINTLSSELDEVAEAVDSLDRNTTRNIAAVTTDINLLVENDAELTRRITNVSNRVESLETGTGAIQLAETDISADNNTRNLAEKLAEMNQSISDNRANDLARDTTISNLSASLQESKQTEITLSDSINALDRKTNRNITSLSETLEDLSDAFTSLNSKTTKNISALTAELEQTGIDLQTLKSNTTRSINDLYNRIDNANISTSTEGDSSVSVTNLNAYNVKYADTNVQAALESLETSVDSLDRKTTRNINNLTTSVETMEDNLTTADTKLTRLNTSVVRLTDAQDVLDENIGTLERNFNRTITGINENIEDIQSTHTRDIQGINSRLSSVENTLANSTISDGTGTVIVPEGNISASNVSYGVGSNVKAKLDSLTNDLTYLDSNTSNKFTRLQGDVDALDEAVSSVSTRVTRQINQITTKVEDIEDSNSSFTTRINNKILDMTDAVTECESKVDNLNIKVNGIAQRDTLSAENVTYGNSNVQDKLNEIFSLLNELSGNSSESNTSILDVVLPKNAGSHNGVYRGESLGNSITDEQIAAVRAGTFDGMYVGDYWTIDGIKYTIAGFNLFLNTGPENDNEIEEDFLTQFSSNSVNYQQINDDFLIRFSEDDSEYKLKENHIVLVPDEILDFNKALSPKDTLSGGVITIPPEDTTPSGEDTTPADTTPSGEDTTPADTTPSGEDTTPADTTPSGEDTTPADTTPSSSDIYSAAFNTGSYNIAKYSKSSDIIIIDKDSTLDTATDTIITGNDTLEIPDIEITLPASSEISTAEFNTGHYNVSRYNRYYANIIDKDTIIKDTTNDTIPSDIIEIPENIQVTLPTSNIESINSNYNDGFYNISQFNKNLTITSGSDTLPPEDTLSGEDTTPSDTTPSGEDTIPSEDTTPADTTPSGEESIPANYVTISSAYNMGEYQIAQFNTPDFLTQFSLNETENIEFNGYKKHWYTRKTIEKDGKLVSKWVRVNYRLLSEIAVFGARIYGKAERTEITSQFPLFKLNPEKANIGQDYWLSDVVQGTENCCMVTRSGEAYYANVETTKGIRPFFIIG